MKNIYLKDFEFYGAFNILTDAIQAQHIHYSIFHFLKDNTNRFDTVTKKTGSAIGENLYVRSHHQLI